MAGGRPTKRSPQIIKKLEEAAALDCTIGEMCFYAGISKQTYHTWVNDDPELLDRLEELRESPVLAARTTIVKAIKTNPQQASWYLERKRKKEFAERKEHTAADGEPLFDVETKNKATAAIQEITGGGDTRQGN